MRGGWVVAAPAALVILGSCLAPGLAFAQPDSAVSDAGSEDAPETASEQRQPIRFGELRDSAPATPWWQRLMSLLGIGGLLFIAWLFSTDRRRIPWRVVLWGIGLQLVFALAILKTPVGRELFSVLNDVAVGLLAFTEEGSRFVFGAYLDQEFSFALKVLPTIIFFSALMSVCYHLGIVQRIVLLIARIMQLTMKTSGAETLSAGANIFVGQTEAPLVVRPYVDDMTRSELMSVMVGGFATVAGGVLAAYVGMLHETFPDIAGHLIAASVMSAPAALVVAKVMVPEVDTPKTAHSLALSTEKTAVNVVDAAAQGAADGAKLAINVGAMLLAFLALVALLNYLVGLVPVGANYALGLEGGEAFQPWTLQQILGYAMSPVAVLMGVPPEDSLMVGTLLGEKIILNEFVAYAHLSESLTRGEPMQYRSVVIAAYALCGFANFGSIGIQIGGIGGIAPGRRGDLAKLGIRAMIGGTLAACLTATVAGLLL